MIIGERVKQLRKEFLQLTQQEFSDRLNLSRSNLGNIETGRVEITDRTISDICREFGVNEIWLRTGEGEMFQQLSRDEEIAAFVGRVLSPKGLDIQRRFIAALSQLDEEDWLVLDKFIDLMQKDKKKD